MKFRPCIDLHKGKVKQIIGSTFSNRKKRQPVINFETEKEPSFYSRMYKRDNLYGGHVIMLGPGNEKAAIDALSEFPQGMHVGGGISPDNAYKFLNAGASHIIVTSYVFKDGNVLWDNLRELFNKVGKGHLVLDLSCKKKNNEYYIVTNRWQNFTNVTITENILKQFSNYCDEFLVHAAELEGKRQGIDTDLVRLLTKFSPIPVTYAGGIRSIDDFNLVDNYGCGKVDATVGSALDIFGGSLKYDDVVSWHRTHSSY